MPALRTLPEALADGRAQRHGLPFRRRARRKRRRSYAEIYAGVAARRRRARALGLRRGDLVAIIVGDPESS